MVTSILTYHLIALWLSLYILVTGFTGNLIVARWQGYDRFSAPNFCLWIASNYVTGLVSVFLSLLLLAALGLFQVRLIVTTGFIVISASLVYLSRTNVLISTIDNLKNIDKQLILTHLPLLILFIALLTIPIRPANHWDDVSYHLPYARFYLQHHGLVVNDYLRYPLFPHNMEMLYALALGLSDEILAQTINANIGFVTVVAIVGLGQYLLRSHFAAYLAASFFIMTPFIRNIFGYAYVDMGLTLCVTVAITNLAIWENQGSRYHVWISAIAMSGAIGIKYFGLPILAIILLWLLLSRRDFLLLSKYGFLVCLLGCWWYLRNIYYSGNPVHPIFMNIFGEFNWNMDDFARQRQEQATHGIPHGLWELPFPILKMRAGLLLLLPFALLYIKQMSRALTMMLFVSFSYYISWFYMAQIDRYLMPVLPMAYIVSCFVVVATFESIKSRLGRDCWSLPEKYSAITFIVLFGMLAVYQAKKFIAQGYDFSEILKKKNPGYELMQQANRYSLRYGSRIYQLGFENSIYYFKGVAIGDYFGIGRYWQLLNLDIKDRNALKNSDELSAIMKRFNANMLVINKAYSYDRSDLTKKFEILFENDKGILLATKQPAAGQAAL